MSRARAEGRLSPVSPAPISPKQGTLLEKFLRDRIVKDYTPRRIRVRKGEKKGFPLKKFNASLHRMTNLPLKKIASKLEVNYSLLSRWGKEPDFKKLVEEHNLKFVAILLTKISIKILSYSSEVNNFLSGKTKEEPRELNFHEELSDVERYSEELLNVIIWALNWRTIKKFAGEMEKMEDFAYISLDKAFYPILNYALPSHKWVKSRVKETKKILSKNIAISKDLINNKKILTKQDRWFLRKTFDNMEFYFRLVNKTEKKKGKDIAG